MKLNIAILLSLSLMLVAVAGAYAPATPIGMATDGIVVTEHRIMVIQGGERLTVSESVMFNNTGDGVFEGKVQVRIPGDACFEFATGQYHVRGGEDAHVYWSLVLYPGESALVGLVYGVTPQVSGLIWKTSIFEIELQYLTDKLILTAITEKDVMASAAGLMVIQESRYNETVSMNEALFVGVNMAPQRVELAIEWTKASTATAKYVGGIALVMVLIALPILKSRGIKKEGREELEYRNEALLSTLNQIEDDHRAGETPEVEYRELKSEYENQVIKIMKKLDEIREDAAELRAKRTVSRKVDKARMPDIKVKKPEAKESIRELKGKKDALISMLKQIEDNYKAGAITKNEYQELKSEYEDKAIKIMRRLDEVGQGRKDR